MQATIAIIPKPGLSPADYQRLAHQLALATSTLPATENCTGGMSAIDDLLAGELPKTIVMRVMSVWRGLKASFKEHYVPLAASDVAVEVKKGLAGQPLADMCDAPLCSLT